MSPFFFFLWQPWWSAEMAPYHGLWREDYQSKHNVVIATLGGGWVLLVLYYSPRNPVYYRTFYGECFE
jgi:hypothetical protein